MKIMASLPLPMKGSCYCKKISYTLNATPIFTNCCHCRNCQSLSGSAFGLNIMVESSAIKITSDTQPAEKLQDGQTEDAPKDKSYLCPGCNTMLFATVGHFGHGVNFLRAGTLDESERIVPSAHFFVRSKHPWIQLPEGVPIFEALPTKDDPPLFTGEAKKRFDAARGKGSSG